MKTRALLCHKSTIELSSISYQLSFVVFMFLLRHLPSHWRSHTLVQKNLLWQRSHIPPPHHHRHRLPVCLICSMLVMRLSSGTLPTTGCQVHSGFSQWKCELSSQISSTWKTTALHLLKREGEYTEWVCQPPQVTKVMWASLSVTKRSATSCAAELV